MGIVLKREFTYLQVGMDLADLFAAHALAGMLADGESVRSREGRDPVALVTARRAYEMAEYMLRARVEASEASEAEKDVVLRLLPETDAQGHYCYPDRSCVFPSIATPGAWIASDPQGAMQDNADGTPIMFASAADAARALLLDGVGPVSLVTRPAGT